MINEVKDMNKLNIILKDERDRTSNDLYACQIDDVMCISIFEFECELSLESTKKLRDFLTKHILESEDEAEQREK